MIVKYTVTEEGRGRTVLSVLKNELELSASLIRRLKREQGIFADGVPVYTNHILSPGETVSAVVTAGEPPCDIVPESGEIDIIRETEWMLAVNKPHGLIVHPSHSRYTDTLANYVAGYLMDRYGDGTCHAVNRLDRDTSGVVLFARNGHVKDRLAKSIRNTGVKEYAAVVLGRPEADTGIIDAPIKRLRDRELLRVIAEDGQRAVTHFRVRSSHMTKYGLISVLGLRLETGRTHQIRAHCLHIGCPILGDRMYYTDESRRISEELGIDSQLLHAERLSFFDPFSDEYIDLEAAPKRPGFQKFD